MLNPLRSEAEAFRFLLGTIVYFMLIVGGTLIGGRWLGLAVFVLSTAGAVWLVKQAGSA